MGVEVLGGEKKGKVRFHGAELGENVTIIYSALEWEKMTIHVYKSKTFKVYYQKPRKVCAPKCQIKIQGARKILLLPNWKQVGESKWGQQRGLEWMTDSDEAAKASFKECLLTSKEKKKSFLSKKKKKTSEENFAYNNKNSSYWHCTHFVASIAVNKRFMQTNLLYPRKDPRGDGLQLPPFERGDNLPKDTWVEKCDLQPWQLAPEAVHKVQHYTASYWAE